MKKITVMAEVVSLLLVLGACGGQNTVTESSDSYTIQSSLSAESVKSGLTENESNTELTESSLTENESDTESAESSLTENESDAESLESWTAKMEEADEKIKELTESNGYVDGSVEERKELAEKLLKELEQEGKIINLYYDESGYLFSFQYANGVLGGIQLKDFGGQIDEPPMN